MEKLTRTEYQEILSQAKAEALNDPYLRIGQCLYNKLYDYNAELARSINGTEADPFHASLYGDPRIVAFENAIIQPSLQIDKNKSIESNIHYLLKSKPLEKMDITNPVSGEIEEELTAFRNQIVEHNLQIAKITERFSKAYHCLYEAN